MRFLFSFVVQLFCHNSPSAHVLALAQSASSAEFSILYLSFMNLKIFNSSSLYRAVAKYCGVFRAEFFKTHKFLQLSGRFGNQSSGSEIINICHCFPSMCLWQISVISFYTFPLWVGVHLQNHFQHWTLGSYYLSIRDFRVCVEIFCYPRYNG